MRIEQLSEVLSQPLGELEPILEVLVTAAAQDQMHPELWEQLQEAAVRDRRTSDLAAAYQRLVGDRRMRSLPVELQVELYLKAARLFGTLLGETDLAVEVVLKSLVVHPGNEASLALLNELLTEAGQPLRHAKVLLDVTRGMQERERQVRILEQVAWIAQTAPEAEPLGLEANERILRIDTGHRGAREALEAHYLAAGKHREAAQLLERCLPKLADADEVQGLHRRLAEAYIVTLGEPQKAIAHVEALLAANASDTDSVAMAEALLKVKPVAGRAAGALADAHERLGNSTAAAAMFDFELEYARGPRRTEVQRRLAVIRQDVLGDPAGALELFGPVVAADPGNDDVRARFSSLSEQCGKLVEATRLLTRALQLCKDPAVRVRVGTDIGYLFLKAGDVNRAQVAWQQVMESGREDDAVLAAARGLLRLHSVDETPVQLAGALELVARIEPEPAPRHEAAFRLAQLCEGELADPARALSAWHALIDSPWAEEALTRLEAAYEQAHDDQGLADVFDRKADFTQDPEQSRQLRFRAAELRSAGTRDRQVALNAWRSFVQRYGPMPEAYARLIPLLEKEKQWEELCAVLESQAALVEPEQRASLLSQLGHVRLTHLNDLVGALQAFRDALTADPADRASRSAVEALLGSEAARVAAALILEPVYRAEQAHSGLVRVLETRAAAVDNPDDRMAVLAEAAHLAETELRNPGRALSLAGWALREAVEHRPEAIEPWLERVQQLGQATGDSAVQAQILSEVLQDRDINSGPLLAVSLAAGDSLSACGEYGRATAVYRRALDYEPSSPELLRRMDELLAQQASPEERLALYRSALEHGPAPARRRELLHAMATLQRRDLSDLQGALETWRRATTEDPADWVAHQALIGVFAQQRDWESVYLQLQQALAHLAGERRTQALLQMVDAAVASGEFELAAEHCTELMTGHELDDAALANMEKVAVQHGKATLVRDILLRRIDRAGVDTEKAALLGRLGEVLAGQLSDSQGAARAWTDAAQLTEGSGGDEAGACLLYERVLETAPDDRSAAERLLELRARGGQYGELRKPFDVTLRVSPDRREALAWLQGIEPQAVAAGALDEFLDLVDTAMQRDQGGKSAASLLTIKVRVLATDPARQAETVAVYRRLLEISPSDPAVADAFDRYLASAPQTQETVEVRRSFYRWRTEHATDPVAALRMWADVEANTFGNPEAAVGLYERVLKMDPDRSEVLGELARLRALAGDAEGALAALQSLREHLGEEMRAPVELMTARLLMDAVGRPEQALEVLEPLVEASPNDPELIELVHRGLSHPDSRQRAAALIEKVADSAADAATQANLFEQLLEISRGQAGFESARGRWFVRLAAAYGDEPEKALEIALRGAEELVDDLELWGEVEQLARDVGVTDAVVDGYLRTLSRAPSPQAAEALGQRMVEFFEEWFEAPDRVLELLQTVLQAAPGVGWAFHRLKLAFNGAARWDDLFSLYDQALEHSSDTAQQIDLLREVSMAAKDFAGDVDRAVGYLVRLHAMQPEDARVEASLERLYERHGYTRPLIELLLHRMESAQSDERIRLHARIAGLWLDLNEPLAAFELVDRMIRESGDTGRALDLLERLVALPCAGESQLPPPPDSERRNRRKRRREPGRTITVRERSAEFLLQHYQSVGLIGDMVRMLEVHVEVARDDTERAQRLRRVVGVRLEQLDDASGAFENLMTLVQLQPADEGCRRQLGELAERVGARDRQAEMLVVLGDACEAGSLRVSLWSEAAEIYERALGQPARAIELYQQVLASAAQDRAAALAATRALDVLLGAADRPEERCTVLEQRAALETDPDARRNALGQAGKLSMQVLGDPRRAVTAWRQRLADDPQDSVALDGVVEALGMAQQWSELIEALQQRARLTPSAEAARADRVRVAHVFTEQLRELDRAIEAWRTVRQIHGNDRMSFDALRALLYATERHEELAQLLDGEVQEETDPNRRSALHGELGELHRDKTGQMLAALEAFVSATDWDRAIDVAGMVRSDADTGRSVCENLLDLAVEAWDASKDESSGPARAAAWSIEELSRRLGELGDFAGVVALLLRGAGLRFATARRRTLRQDAAFLCADRLSDPERAIDIFRGIVAEDAGDAVARASVVRLAELLEARGALAEVAELWEEQSEARLAQGEPETSTALWARAGELWERRLGDTERAIRDHRRGAALGGEASLEALARIYAEQGDLMASAEVLEWLVVQSGRDRLGARALQLAEAYVAAGRSDRARARLEQAMHQLSDATAVRQRLAELYREAEQWAQLADLLADEAGRAATGQTRLALLNEAARVHLEERDDPASAVPLLEQAVELRGDDYQLRLALADALQRAGRFEDAAGVLQEQIENYGARRPKERALVHYALAEALTALGRRAESMVQLQTATRIDPAHPGILRRLARLAFEGGELDRAEQTYRALLLVLGSGADPGGASRAEALLDLSELAVQRGNAERGQEFVESAFEAAAESEQEAEALERLFRERGQQALLGRAIQARLDAARDPAAEARALADLAAHALETTGEVQSVERQLRNRAVTLLGRMQAEGVVDGEAWAALGQVFKALGDPNAEERVLTQQVDSLLKLGTATPADAGLLYRLAEVHLTRRPVRLRGLDLLEKALQLSPDPKRAERIMRAALDSGVEDERALLLLERVARQTGEQRALAEALVRLVERSGDPGDLADEAVELARSLADPAMSERLLSAVLSNEGVQLPGPSAAWARLELARFRAAAGDLAGALHLREHAAESMVPPQQRTLLLEVAGSYAAELGDDARAAAVYELLLEMDPGDRQAWEPLLEAYRRLGNTSDILALMDRTAPLLDSQEDRARMRLEQARLMLDRGENDNALDVLRQIVVEDPGQLQAVALLTDLLDRTGNRDELVSLLVGQLDAAKDRGDVAGIRSLAMRLGTLLEQQDRTSEALDAYQGLLEWDPSDKDALNAVLRLAEQQQDWWRAADALEGLLQNETGEATMRLTERLVALREQQGDSDAVERALRLGFERDPSQLVLREKLLERFRSRGDWESVADTLDRSVAAAPEDIAALQVLVDARRSAGQHELALGALDRLMAVSLQDAGLFRQRAELLDRMGRSAEAIADLEQAAELDPEHVGSLVAVLERSIAENDEPASQSVVKLAALLEQTGDAEGAKARLLALVERQPEDQQALRQLARLSENQGDVMTAAVAYTRLLALEQGEELETTALRLADISEQADAFEAARWGLERALSENPGKPELVDRLRKMYRASGAHRELASIVMEDAQHEIDPARRLSLLLEAGDLLLGPDGDPQQAWAVLQGARELAPDSPEVVVLLARAYDRAGQAEDAMALLTELLNAHRGRRLRTLAPAHEEMSRIQLREGRLTEALESLTRAFDLDLRNGQLATRLGQLALEVDDLEVATRAFRAVTMMRSSEGDPTDGSTPEAKVDAQYYLASIARQQGDLRKAKMLVGKALASNPDHEKAKALSDELDAASG
ncbi:MAG: tetratricopeptide repeat protein [Polyangiaceae bacterium]|nr:tetratricopeptide repeat protein [Polyangiaceae bacterium]